MQDIGNSPARLDCANRFEEEEGMTLGTMISPVLRLNASCPGKCVSLSKASRSIFLHHSHLSWTSDDGPKGTCSLPLPMSRQC